MNQNERDMNSFCSRRRRKESLIFWFAPNAFIAAATLALALAANAATHSTNATVKAIAPPPEPPPIPQSAFSFPSTPKEGKDPFFPSSTRPYAVAAANAKTNMPAIVSNVPLHLSGVSGSLARPLAIINNRTFAVGEENDVMTDAGRVRIRCLDIDVKRELVLVQAGGQRRELRLRAGI
jgi:hypothetical protein